MMLAEVLVGLEDSPGGERALKFALEVGQSVGATLVGFPVDALNGSRFVLRAAEQGVAARALDLPVVHLREQIQIHDLTILSREAHGRFGAFGDDARARKPVLVVPDQPPVTGGSVLIAYDGSAASKRATRSFGESGLARGRSVHVASVGDDPAAAWETAVDGCELLFDLGVTAAAHNLSTPLTVARALLEHRANLGAALLVLGGYARSPLARLQWGSVTQEMLDRSEVPLFLQY